MKRVNRRGGQEGTMGFGREKERRKNRRREGRQRNRGGRMIRRDGKAGAEEERRHAMAKVKTGSEKDRWLEEMGNTREIYKVCYHQRQHLLRFFFFSSEHQAHEILYEKNKEFHDQTILENNEFYIHPLPLETHIHLNIIKALRGLATKKPV